MVNAGTSHKSGAYLPDKLDATTIPTFDAFCTRAETTTGKKICQIQSDCAYDSTAWDEYCKWYSIKHEFTALYSSAQNGLAEQAIRTTIDDVRTLLNDSGLSHSYWAEAAAFSINTRNLIPSHCHPGCIPAESFSGKRQSVTHLHVFGARCWAKTPITLGGSKLDPRSIKCWILGYTSGSGNYKVQDVLSCHVVSRDVVFDERRPCRTASVGSKHKYRCSMWIQHWLHSLITNLSQPPRFLIPSKFLTLLFLILLISPMLIKVLIKLTNTLSPLNHAVLIEHPNPPRLVASLWNIEGARLWRKMRAMLSRMPGLLINSLH